MAEIEFKVVKGVMIRISNMFYVNRENVNTKSWQWEKIVALVEKLASAKLRMNLV